MKLPRAAGLAILLGAVVLFAPRFRDIQPWTLEAKGVLLILGMFAIGFARPDTAAARWAWVLAAVHALSCAATGMDGDAVLRTAVLAALAAALTLVSRLPLDTSFPPLLRALGGLGAATGFLVFLQRTATFDHKGLAAAFLAIALPVVLVQAAVARGRAKAIWLAALALTASGLVMGETRSAWLGAGAGTALALPFLFKNSRRNMAWLLLALVLGGGAAAALGQTRFKFHLVDRVTSIVRNRDPRLALWKVSWNLWQEHPWLGQGPGHYAEAISLPASRALGEAHVDSFSSVAHNDVLQLGVETGWPGILALLGLGAALALGAARGLKRLPPAQRPLPAAAAGGLLAGAVNMAFCFPLYDPGCALALALLAGLVAAGGRKAPPSEALHHPCKPLALGIALALMLSLRLPLAKLTLSASLAPDSKAVLMGGVDAAPPGSAAGSEALRKARRRFPSSGEVWRRMGQAAVWGRDPKRAEPFLARAVLLAPWDPDARIGLAYARFLAGDPPGAYTVLAHARDIFPAESSWVFHLVWGDMLFKEGQDWKAAWNHMDQFLYECPDPHHPRRVEIEHMRAVAWSRCP